MQVFLNINPNFSNTDWALSVLALVTYSIILLRIYHSKKESVQQRNPYLAWLSLPALLFHGLLVLSLIFQNDGLQLGLVNIVCLIAFLSASLTVSSSLYRPTLNLCLFNFPLAMLSIVLLMVFPSKAPLVSNLSNQEFIHICLSLLAFSVFTISAGQAIFISILDYQLRNRLLRSWHTTFPALQTLEASLFEMISLGIVLLTFSIGSGFLFLENIFAQHVAHKMFFSVISWLIFVCLLTGKLKFGWRGTRAIQLVLAGYALLFIAFIGSKFVMEILLERV